MRRRSPRPVSGALERLTAELSPATLLAEVQRVWEPAAGDAFAGRCVPTGERDGVVTIACGSAVLAQELALLSDLVVARLNEDIGRPAVRSLRPEARPPRWSD